MAESDEVDNTLASSIFSSINEIQRAIPVTARQSMGWLQGIAKNLVSRAAMNETNDPTKSVPGTFTTRRLDRRYVGKMFMYMYDPKTKARMPYYDTLPLTILVEFTRDGFYGLNLHYAPPLMRKKILAALDKNMNRAGISEAAKTRMSYRILKRLTLFEIMKPCFKRYLASHVRSSYLYIDPLEWNNTVMLPTERFKKATKNQVFRDYSTKGATKTRNAQSKSGLS